MVDVSNANPIGSMLLETAASDLQRTRDGLYAEVVGPVLAELEAEAKSMGLRSYNRYATAKAQLDTLDSVIATLNPAKQKIAAKPPHVVAMAPGLPVSDNASYTNKSGARFLHEMVYEILEKRGECTKADIATDLRIHFKRNVTPATLSSTIQSMRNDKRIMNKAWGVYKVAS